MHRMLLMVAAGCVVAADVANVDVLRPDSAAGTAGDGIPTAAQYSSTKTAKYTTFVYTDIKWVTAVVKTKTVFLVGPEPTQSPGTAAANNGNGMNSAGPYSPNGKANYYWYSFGNTSPLNGNANSSPAKGNTYPSNGNTDSYPSNGGNTNRPGSTPDSSSSSPSSPSAWSDEAEFQGAILNMTNGYRARHQAKSLTWDPQLARSSAEYANGKADCSLQHSGRQDVGENIAYGQSSPESLVKGWGDEEQLYSPQSPVFSLSTSHFTQLVWKKTTRVGCAWRQCPSSPNRFLACQYSPPGNRDGEFEQNVS